MLPFLYINIAAHCVRLNCVSIDTVLRTESRRPIGLIESDSSRQLPVTSRRLLVVSTPHRPTPRQWKQPYPMIWNIFFFFWRHICCFCHFVYEILFITYSFSNEFKFRTTTYENEWVRIVFADLFDLRQLLLL